MVDHFDIFFIKQKTAYEMRISDWISDWFSSDLRNAPSALHRAAGASGAAAWARAAASAGAIIPIVRAAIAATAYPCSMIVSVNLVIRALPPASAAPVGGTGRRSLDEQGKPQEQKRRDEIHRRERIKGHPQGIDRKSTRLNSSH